MPDPYRTSAESPLLLECPSCRQPTAALKRYSFPAYLVFVVFFLFSTTSQTVACPRCMRKDLLTRCAIHVVLANLLWPIVILPWALYLLYRSSQPGHFPGAEHVAIDRTGG